jgi:hypothetical protein
VSLHAGLLASFLPGWLAGWLAGWPPCWLACMLACVLAGLRACFLNWREQPCTVCGVCAQCAPAFAACLVFAVTCEVQYALPGHKGSVNEVVFHPKEPIVGSCSNDRTIFLGELAEN